MDSTVSSCQTANPSSKKYVVVNGLMELENCQINCSLIKIFRHSETIFLIFSYHFICQSYITHCTFFIPRNQMQMSQQFGFQFHSSAETISCLAVSERKHFRRFRCWGIWANCFICHSFNHHYDTVPGQWVFYTMDLELNKFKCSIYFNEFSLCWMLKHTSKAK